MQIIQVVFTFEKTVLFYVDTSKKNPATEAAGPFLSETSTNNLTVLPALPALASLDSDKSAK